MHSTKRSAATEATGILPGGRSAWTNAALLALAVLVIGLLEALVFVPLYRQTGFYLDDWATLEELIYGPQGFWAASQNLLFNDAKILIRPLQAPYFGLLYTIFGAKPLGYHLVNAFFEALGGVLAFQVMRRLGASFVPALLAAAAFLLYPGHDCTHYWVLCSSPTLSMSLYLLSLLGTIETVKTGKLSWHILGLAAFALSIFNYETFLPLCAVNAFVAFLLVAPKGMKAAFTKSSMLFAPYIGLIGFLLFYQRHLITFVGRAWMHSVQFDPALMIRTIWQGVMLNMPWNSFPFFAKQADLALQGFSALGVGAFIPVVLVAVIAFKAFSALSGVGDLDGKIPRFARNDKTNVPAMLMVIGGVLLVVSFSIFGLNPEYMPTFASLVNRVNYAAGLALAFIVCGIAQRFVTAEKTVGARTRNLLVALSGTVLIVFFALANCGLAKPWMLSWQVQKHVFDLLAENKAKFHDGDSVMLSNCPGYTMWAPVFDGVWDFEAVVHIALNNQNVRGGVVSDRIHLSSVDARDISRGYTCGVYPFSGQKAAPLPVSGQVLAPGTGQTRGPILNTISNMYMIFPHSSEVRQIFSAKQFVESASESPIFSVTRETRDRWQSELGTGGVGAVGPGSVDVREAKK